MTSKWDATHTTTSWINGDVLQAADLNDTLAVTNPGATKASGSQSVTTAGATVNITFAAGELNERREIVVIIRVDDDGGGQAHSLNATITVAGVGVGTGTFANANNNATWKSVATQEASDTSWIFGVCSKLTDSTSATTNHSGDSTVNNVFASAFTLSLVFTLDLGTAQTVYYSVFVR